MRIGIDASRIARDEKSGTENYTLNLIRALAAIDRKNYYQLYFNQPPKFFELPGGNFASKVIASKRFWTQLRLAAELAINPVDLLFVPAHTLPVLRRPALKTVVTVHDLGAQFLKEYHEFPSRYYLNWSTAFVANYASHLIAVSGATKKDLTRRFKVPASRITVVHEGVDQSFFKRASEAEIELCRKKYGLASKYFLFVGTIQPRKNLTRLIEAFARSRLNLDLAIAGQPGWLYKEIYEAPERFGVENKVKFLGFVPNEDIVKLYSGSTAFVFPSLYEGFGLPVLEAMACGCPVITSSVSSLPEVAGEAAVLVDPDDTKAIEKALKDVATDPTLRERLTAAGYRRVKDFTWERSAKETLAVLAKVGQK